MNFTKINKKFKEQEEILNEKKQLNSQQKEIRRQKAIQDFIKLYEKYLCIDQQIVSPAQIEKQKLKMTRSSQCFFQNAEQTDQKLLKDCAQVEKLIDYKNPFLRQIQSEIVLQQKEIVDQMNLRRQIRTPSSQRQKNRLLSKGNKNLKQAGSVSRSSVQFRRLINQQARKILPSFKGLKKILQDQFSDQTMSKQAQKRLNQTNLLNVMDSNIVPRKGSDLEQMRNQIKKFVKQGRGVEQFATHLSIPVSPVSRKVQMNLNKIYSKCQGQLFDIRGLYEEFDDFEKQMDQTSKQQKAKVVNAYIDPFADWLKNQKKSNPFTQMKGRFMQKYS